MWTLDESCNVCIEDDEDRIIFVKAKPMVFPKIKPPETGIFFNGVAGCFCEKTNCVLGRKFQPPNQLNLNTSIPLDVFSSVHFLESGKFCNVFTALCNKKILCLKMPKADMNVQGAATKHLEQELNILQNIQHPHIIRILGAGTDAAYSELFLVMEYIEGGSLQAMLEKLSNSLFPSKQLPNFVERLSFCIQIAGALEYLHFKCDPNLYILHRDLKPKNITITSQRSIKLIDFGLARAIPKSDEMIEETFEMSGKTGTPRYMAPEVFMNQPYNQKADVYSFSILCWQLLSKKEPYFELTMQIFERFVVHKNLRPKCPKKWPVELSRLLETAWNKEHSVRPNADVIRGNLESIWSMIEH